MGSGAGSLPDTGRQAGEGAGARRRVRRAAARRMHAGALGLSALLLAAEQSARECPAAPTGRLPRSPLQPPDPSGRPGTHGPPLPQQAACPGGRTALCARACTVARRPPSPSPVGPHEFTALSWSLGTCIPAAPSGKASWTQPRGRGPECAVRSPPSPPPRPARGPRRRGRRPRGPGGLLSVAGFRTRPDRLLGERVLAQQDGNTV